MDYRIRAREGTFSVRLPECDPRFAQLGLTWVSQLQDTPLSDKGLKPSASFQKFLKTFERSPISVIAEYARLGDIISFQDVTTDDAFKAFQKTPIFREFHQFVRTGDSSILRYLLTFCYFGKKAYTEDQELYDAALRSWKDTDNGLPTSFDQRDVSLLKLILEQILSDSGQSAELLPRHGGGSTADKGRLLSKKYEKLVIDPALDRLIRHGGQFWHHGEYWNSGLRHLEFVVSRLKRTAKGAFATKSYKAYRSIVAEPAVLQFFQQSIRRLLEKEIAASPHLSFVKINDQTWNQQLCLRGSVDNSLDTTDLSRASDSVSWDLVKEIFPRKWVYYFAATRSKAVKLPNGETVRVKKFAPMGSAVCFPVQCVIYAAIVIAAGFDQHTDTVETPTRVGVHNYLHSREFEQLKTQIGVYGDDIITPGLVTPSVISRLTRLGFEVNTDKSCIGETRIRESCGVYAYKGEYVTPLYYRFPVKPSKDPEVFASQWFQSRLALINRLGDFGYTQTRRIAIKILQSDPIVGWLARGVFFSNKREDALSVFTTRDITTNKHLRTRSPGDARGGSASSERYMRDEIRRLTIPSQRCVASLTEENRLYEWLRQRPGSAVDRDDNQDPVTTISFVKGKVVIAAKNPAVDVVPTRLRWGWSPI